MGKIILPPAWREAWAEFNEDYLRSRRNIGTLLGYFAALAIICVGFFFGAWVMAPLP